MIVINIWGAPSSGKSTTAAGLFFLMKINKMKVELVHEFAKELVLERRENVFGDQNFIFAEQCRRIRRLEDHNFDFAITDSPAPLPAFYDENMGNAFFKPFVMEEFRKDNNINYLLRRKHAFEAIGRRHNEEQSLAIDLNLRKFMDNNQIEYTEVEANPLTPETILSDIRRRMPQIVGLPFSNLSDEKLS